MVLVIFGGRTIPCTRGVYWRDQGKAPCEDLGTIKFRTPDGTEISNTAEITRGYKSGYNIIQTRGTGGLGRGGGNGGAGATGGQGATNRDGAGGGGSGYTDGSVTVSRPLKVEVLVKQELIFVLLIQLQLIDQRHFKF